MSQSGMIMSNVFVLVLIGAHVNPIEGRELGGPLPSPPEEPLDTYVHVTKRETTHEVLGDGTSGQCEVVSLPKGPGDDLPNGSGEEHLGQFLQRRFFFRPGPDFERMVFRMRLQNTLTGNPSFQVSPGLTFDADDLPNSTRNSTGDSGRPEDDWLLVEVEDFEFVRDWGRDRNALRVSIDGVTKDLVVKYWFSVNRYSGFDLYAKGESSWAFECDPRNRCPERVQLALTGPPPDVSHVWCWLIIGALLLVLVVTLSLLIVVARGSSAPRSGPQQWSLGKDSKPDLPQLKSTDEQQSKAKNLYVTGPVRPHAQDCPVAPADDEHLYAEISEASFVAWSDQMSDKYLQSVSLGPKVATE